MFMIVTTSLKPSEYCRNCGVLKCPWSHNYKIKRIAKAYSSFSSLLQLIIILLSHFLNIIVQASQYYSGIYKFVLIYYIDNLGHI